MKRRGRGRNLSTWHVGLPASRRPITSWARIFMGGPIRNCCISLLFRCVIGPIVFAPRNYQAAEQSLRKDPKAHKLPPRSFPLPPPSLTCTLRRYLTSGNAKIAPPRSPFQELEENMHIQREEKRRCRADGHWNCKHCANMNLLL